MADELFLNYGALEAAASRFTELGDDLRARVPIPPCDTGIVDVSAALTTITESATSLADHLATLSTITTEVKNEVITIDDQQQKRYPPFNFGTPLYPTTPTFPLTPDVAPLPLPPNPDGTPAQPQPLPVAPPSYVDPGLPGGDPHLDLPPELTPMGPYAPGTDPS